MRITYQKSNGEIFHRIRNTYCPYRVGETTSMGWKVLAIEYKYKGKYYDKIDYDRLTDKDYYIEKQLLKIKQKFNYLYKNVNHVLIFIILFRSFELLLLKAL